MIRRILHLDMDAFFSSVEQQDHPEYRGRPVIVGGVSNRGVVSAASYEARRYGVHSAMPMVRARRLCPQGVFLPGRMRRYKEVSDRIMALLEGFSPLVEQASVDEAYLDATGLERLFGSPASLAADIKNAIREATGLTCSIGVAPVKFLAKIASDRNKPDGVFILEDADVPAFLASLPVERIPGVGGRTVLSLRTLGVERAGDVLRYPASFWERRFGKWGVMLHERAQGIDPREVTPREEPKSDSAENTFEQDTRDKEELRRWLLLQSERVGRSLRRMGKRGRTVTLKVKFDDFRQITRSRTLPEAVNDTESIFRTASELLEALSLDKSVRLVGVGVSGFTLRERQLSLLDSGQEEKRERLDRAVDAVRDKFGRQSLVRGRIFQFKP